MAAGVGAINAAATVASPAVIAPGAVTLEGKRVAKTKRVTLAGKAEPGRNRLRSSASQIWGAVGKAALKPLKSVTAKANGSFTLVLAKGARQTSFQARRDGCATRRRADGCARSSRACRCRASTPP